MPDPIPVPTPSPTSLIDVLFGKGARFEKMLDELADAKRALPIYEQRLQAAIASGNTMLTHTTQQDVDYLRQRLQIPRLIGEIEYQRGILASDKNPVSRDAADMRLQYLENQFKRAFGEELWEIERQHGQRNPIPAPTPLPVAETSPKRLPVPDTPTVNFKIPRPGNVLRSIAPPFLDVFGEALDLLPHNRAIFKRQADRLIEPYDTKRIPPPTRLY